MLRWKSKVDLSSNGQKNFICREEKGKVTWAHAAGPGNWWSVLSGWKSGFIAFCCPRAKILVWTDVKEELSLWHKQMFLGRKKGRFSLWLIFTFWEHKDFLQSTLQVPPLNDCPNCNRKNTVYSVTDS
jgi:phage FluMu protein Com